MAGLLDKAVNGLANEFALFPAHRPGDGGQFVALPFR
jgi:hypothetical protein